MPMRIATAVIFAIIVFFCSTLVEAIVVGQALNDLEGYQGIVAGVATLIVPLGLALMGFRYVMGKPYQP